MLPCCTSSSRLELVHGDPSLLRVEVDNVTEGALRFGGGVARPKHGLGRLSRRAGGLLIAVGASATRGRASARPVRSVYRGGCFVEVGDGAIRGHRLGRGGALRL